MMEWSGVTWLEMVLRGYKRWISRIFLVLVSYRKKGAALALACDASAQERRQSKYKLHGQQVKVQSLDRTNVNRYSSYRHKSKIVRNYE